MLTNLTRKTITLYVLMDMFLRITKKPKNYLTLCSVYFVTLHFRITAAYTEIFEGEEPLALSQL